MGGNFVLKMFTIFDLNTIQTLINLEAHFNEVFCYKPSSSKPGNSEVKIFLIILNLNKKIYFGGIIWEAVRREKFFTGNCTFLNLI